MKLINLPDLQRPICIWLCGAPNKWPSKLSQKRGRSLFSLSIDPSFLSLSLPIPLFLCLAFPLFFINLWFFNRHLPVTDVVGRQRLRSATQQMMVVPRHRLCTVGRWAFAMQGPMACNSLPDDLRARQDYEFFRQRLKTWLFCSY